MAEDPINRLKEIIRIADKLGWIDQPPANKYDSYPTMQLSEVEKCMLAMVSDADLTRMKLWYNEMIERMGTKI